MNIFSQKTEEAGQPGVPWRETRSLFKNLPSACPNTLVPKGGESFSARITEITGEKEPARHSELLARWGGLGDSFAFSLFAQSEMTVLAILL